MIDDQSEAGSWARTLNDTRKTIEYLSDAELHGPFILDDLMRWYDLPTMREALDMKAAEVKRRTMTNNYGKALKGTVHG
jgi:hypothetical protein